MALPGLSQAELPKYHPIAIGLTVSGQFNYTTVNGGAHIAAGMSFKPLFVTGFSLSIKRDYTPRQSLLTGVSYEGWGLNFGGMGYYYYRMITLPLTGRYYFQNASSRRRWFFEVGPVVRFALIGTNINSSGAFGRGLGGSNPSHWMVSAQTRLQAPTSPTFGALGRLGVEQRLSDRWRFGLSTFYHYGFQNLVENTFEAYVSEAIPGPDDFYIDPESFRIAQQGELSVRGNSWGLMLHVLVYPFSRRTE